MDTVDIFGVKISKLTMDSAFETVVNWLSEEKRGRTIFTPNSEIIMAAREDGKFCDLLNTADMLTPDGIGVVKAASILGSPLSERVGGFDLTARIVEYLGNEGKSLYILGGKPGVADKAAENLKAKYEKLVIAGTHDGYFTEDAPVVEEIAKSAPDYLMVCLGAPKQEKWIAEYKDKLFAKVIIGAGGSADVFAGTVARAPEFYIKHNLEWLYRIVSGKRFGRSLNLIKFGALVYRKKLIGK